MRVIIVKNCWDCPFRHFEPNRSESNDEGDHICRSADRYITTDHIYGRNPRIPPWCKLINIEDPNCFKEIEAAVEKVS